MAKGKVGKTVESLGDYLREQRIAARLSLRQLAEQAGVSNPYLSQIERGLRKPSADGLRSPRSIWLRYGFDTPACSASCRRDSRAAMRCSLR